MRSLSLPAVFSASFALYALASSASAQCFSWATGFAAPPAGNGTNGTVHAMTVWDADGWGPNPPSLYVGGTFTSAGGVSVHGLARWDGTAWHDVGGGVTGDSATVFALAVHDGSLFVAGDFSTAGSTPAANIASWNGSSFSALGIGTAGNGGVVRALESFPDGPGGPFLYAGGDFTSAGGTALNFIARWNGSAWSALGAAIGTSGGVFALKVHDDGSGRALFLGGAFPTAGLTDPNTKFVAKWTGVTFSALGPGLSTSVRALASFDSDGPGPASPVLIAVGDFLSTAGGGTTLNRVAQWSPSSWSAFGAGMSSSVRAVCSFDDECGRALYVGGDFIGPFNGLARWVGGSWKTVGSGSVGSVRALTTFFHDNGSITALYAGGPFSHAGGNPSANFAQLLLADADRDGLYDCWETLAQGIDINCDGSYDLDLYALGARPNRKDIFVEIDSMTGLTPIGDALLDVQAVFDIAPVTLASTLPGINLHLDLDETDILPASWVLDASDWAPAFDSTKSAKFGTPAQRTDPNAANILAAKRLAYHYCIFASSYDTDGSSGLAEIRGNDFMVTLGLWSTPGGTRDQQSGTFMHELGHNLGLYHGGNQLDPNHDRRFNYKPNYHSVMNYTWQSPKSGYSDSWYLDYSADDRDDLDETMIFETLGLDGQSGLFVPAGPPAVFIVEEAGAVDLDGNGSDSDVLAGFDINHLFPADTASPGNTLTGHNDWIALDYNFRDSDDFADGVHSTASVMDELDLATHLALDAIPAPCPADIAPGGGGGGGGGDGLVNIDDLTAIILAWDTADLIADIDNDSLVEIDDLTAVILNWGKCP